MTRVFANGGIIGKNLDFNSTNTYLIEYVGGATTSNTGSNGVRTVTFTDLTGGVGGGVLTGDLVIVSVAAANGGGVDLTMAMTTSGYTTLYDYYNGTRTNDINLGVHYKLMGTTPDTTAITNVTGMISGDSIVVAVQVWRGVSIATPIGAYATMATGQGSLANPPSITTTSPLSKVIAIGGAAHSDGASAVFTQGGDLENFVTLTANNSDDALLGVGAIIGNITSSGTSVDPIAFTKASQNGNSWAATTIELIAKNRNASTKRNSGVWDIGWRYGATTGP
jgi:hypothetical protein